MKRLLQLGSLFMACQKRYLDAGVKTLLPFATLCLLFALTTSAQVTVVTPFVGDHSETWERFGVTDIPDGTSILGGIATITGTNMVTAKSFVMCSVVGQPSDGTILMDSDRPSGPLTISISTPVTAFGAYWGSGLHCLPAGFADAPSILTFQDDTGNVIGTD